MTKPSAKNIDNLLIAICGLEEDNENLSEVQNEISDYKSSLSRREDILIHIDETSHLWEPSLDENGNYVAPALGADERYARRGPNLKELLKGVKGND